jgi:LysR family transcriptional regulator, regulator for bpeEF and oprC
MDQLACMRTFARVADVKSFTKAADALNLSRAVVSTQVAELERHLGARLFHRTTRRVSLTADGTEYLARCVRILAEVNAADEAVNRNRLRPQGRLRVDVPVTFGRYLLTPALPRFTERYPELSLEIQLNDRVVDMVEEQIDVVVRVGPVREPNLVARRVCHTRMLTCAAPSYLQKAGVPQEPDDLRQHRLIGHLSNRNRRARKWYFQRGTSRRQLALTSAVAFNASEPVISTAIAGGGIMQTSDMLVAKAIVSGQLEIVLRDWTADGAPISIVYPAALRNSPKVRVFADFAAELLLAMRQRVDQALASA